MKNRTIRTIQKAQKVNMGGILLDQPLPASSISQIDPFLLIHHWADHIEGGKRPQDVGVGPHPHRGFAPVTFIFKGAIHHRDSRGHSEVIHEGGTQWMNSGMGIIHSERPPKEMAEKGGEFEIIQFWVNIPASGKMEQPFYQSLTVDQTPSLKSEDGKIELGVVAGEVLGVKSHLQTKSPLLIVRGEAEKGGKIELPIPENYNALLYQLDGELSVNGSYDTEAKDMVIFRNDGDGVSIQANQTTRFILLAGEPIAEPVVSHGPFVMNSQTEIMEAMRDYQMGKMGVLIEEF